MSETPTAYVEGKEANKDLRIREQCYLVRNLNRYARSRLLGYEKDLNPDGYYQPSTTYMTAQGRAPRGTGGLAQRFKNLSYTNFDTGKVVSSLAGTSNAGALLNIPTSVLNRLVPHIELYKIFYDVDPTNKGFMSSTGEAVLLPFADSFGPTTADELLKSRAGQGDGIGLKGLNVRFLGTNPAEVKTVLEVSLKIYMRDFAELSKNRNSKKSKSGHMHYAAFSDMISRDLWESYENDRSYRNETYRIRAVLGWAVPTKDNGIFEGVKDANLIKAMIRNTRMILTLSLKGHTLSFNQDGSLVLDATYIARFEADMRDMKKSIFAYNKNKLAAQDGNVRLALKKLNAAKKAEMAVNDGQLHETYTVDFDGNESWSRPLEDWLDGDEARDRREAERAYELALANANLLKQEEMGFAYKSFLGGFFESKKHSLFWAQIPPNVYRQSLDPRVPRPEYGGTTVLVERMGGENAGAGGADVGSSLADGASGRDLSYNAEVAVFQLHGLVEQGEVWAGAVGGGANGRMKKAVDDAFALMTDEQGGTYDDAQAALNKSLSNINDERYQYTDDEPDILPDTENYNLYFTYMGDIIDYALNSIKDPDLTPDGKNLKILLGSFTFIDPMTFENRRVNLSDVPVSITSFLSWIFERYVRKEALEVTPFQFLRDLVQDLGINYLGGKCFSAAHTPITRTKFGMQMTLTIPRVNGKSYLPEGTIIHEKHLKQMAISKSRPEVSKLPPEEMDHVCYIYVTNTLPTDKKGDEKVDGDHGIYHFRLGADRGLVKKVKYKRLDIPGYEEAKIIADDRIDDSKRDPDARPSISALRLREVYNCDIEMYGNTLFYPGMVFYIDPSKMGLDSSISAHNSTNTQQTSQGKTMNPKRALAESLGVKGYYHINKVEHIYESGKYETLLEGIFLTDGNSYFYADKVDTQIEKLNSILGILQATSATEAGSAENLNAAMKYKQAMGLPPFDEPDLLYDEEEISEHASEINDG